MGFNSLSELKVSNSLSHRERLTRGHYTIIQLMHGRF
jgi:hypothetical protein